MGIPRFFKFISEQFPNVAKNTSFNKGFTIPIDNLYLDANGILHNCSAEIYFNKKIRLSHANKKPINKEQELFASITSYIDQLLKFVKPRKLFYIAIDGPAPLAKQSQQRQRRYKASAEKTDEEIRIFDSTCITPGTVFMENLSIYINAFINKMIKTDPIWKNVTIIFSGPDVPGEGEHKIVNYIRQDHNNKKLTHCMYGLDADLFMLSLATHSPNFYLLREDQFRTVWNDTLFYIVDIKALRSGLANKWGVENDTTNIVNDFIFLCFMAGNDFLHSLPPCHDLSESIEFLMDLRLKVLSNNYITCGNSFNLQNLRTFLLELSNYEIKIVSAQYYKQNFPNLTINNSLINPLNPKLGINLEKYRKNYYKKVGINSDNKKQVSDFCKNYIQGLEWVYYYYHNEPINWQWYYPYHYSPLVTDLVEYLTSTSKLSRVSNKKFGPIKPFEQLLCVVPPRNKHLLPDYLHSLYTGSLQKYYPTSFKIDLEGKTKEWEGIALLPFIDINDIFEAYPKDVASHKRNTFGKNIIFNEIKK